MADSLPTSSSNSSGQRGRVRLRTRRNTPRQPSLKNKPATMTKYIISVAAASAFESAVIEAILRGGDHPLISNGGIDVLAVNHHGSESSTNVNLFNGAAPEVAVIATGAGQGGNWHLPRQDVLESVLLAGATDCVTAPAALVRQTEGGAPHSSQTSDAGFCVGNIVIKTNGGTSYAVSADGAVTHGPDERTAADLPATFPIDN